VDPKVELKLDLKEDVKFSRLLRIHIVERQPKAAMKSSISVSWNLLLVAFWAFFGQWVVARFPDSLSAARRGTCVVHLSSFGMAL